MSFLFPRVVRIERAAHQAVGDAPAPPVGGVQPYGGLDPAQTVLIAQGIPASIQRKGTGRSNPTGLPGDPTPYRWAILIPSGHVAEGVIRDGDIISDDLTPPRRFQVAADYTHGLGWTLDAERLET